MNLSGSLSYITLNSKGGRITVFNSMLMKGMLFHEDYILAHTAKVSLKPYR